ncbi:phage regulatory protein, rha family [Maridesulfovibrio ferrireducens]|uniref:Phage regulatory protein, rha family n=1 Tax=Maridesulfovibrio ferrireducens TaxID=246191 RepID=A0A1G9EQ41_9BACT|nr:Rha family transcriptional regulator [Maridesulfovibrio ferrireducens]SDK78266.1 phage regulatory protein, rha family [Maridesulfovibrio ferrireducens]
MNKKSSENKDVRVVVELVMENNQPMVSSIVVAELFGKLHKNVLRDISDLEIPDDFRFLNFQESSYVNLQNKEQLSFNMTRDGFSLLAMGFTGKKAMEWKIKFLEAFNAMEAKLTIPPVEGKIQYKKATPEAVKSFEGMARYWCYLEGFSWEQGKRQIEGAIRVPDIYDMDMLALKSAWTYLNICICVVPPKMRGVNVCSADELAPVNGLLDYWAYCGQNSREELLADTCKKMCIESLEDIPKSYLSHAVSLVWEGINSESGKYNAFQKESS